MDTFGKQALEAHNKFRAAHQAPPLSWSSVLAREAEAWAKQIAREGRLRHDDTKYGENVFMVVGQEIDGSDAVKSWYEEVKKYDFNKGGYQTSTGHFTQVVWRESRELGIGKAKSVDGKTFVVGRYRPAGNRMSAYKDNVLPLKGGPVEIPENEPPKREFTSLRQQQQHYDRPRFQAQRDEPACGAQDSQRREEMVITYPDGTRKTVVSTVTVTLKGNEQSGYTKHTVRTTQNHRIHETFSRDMRTALPQDDFRRANTKTDTSKPLAGTGAGGPSTESARSKHAFSKQALDAHNKHRKKHGVPPMTWSDEIARDAQAWAEKLARTKSLQHASQSERKGTGENIAMFTGKFDTAGEEATEIWYSEVKNYRFGRPGYQGNTGHFTQVVWKASKELGMGRAQSADGKLTFVVARYSPAGNLLNKFEENVLKG